MSQNQNYHYTTDYPTVSQRSYSQLDYTPTQAYQQPEFQMSNRSVGHSPQCVHLGSLDRADIVKQDHMFSPKRSPNLTPVQIILSNNTSGDNYGQISPSNPLYASVNNGSVEKSFITTPYPFSQQSQISPETDFSTATHYDQRNPQFRESFAGFSSSGSNYSGIETFHLDDANDLMDFMNTSTSQDQAASQNLENVQVGKEEKKNKRGRPRKHIGVVEIESPQHKKNIYMQNYNQRLVKNCKKNEELVNLYEQLLESLPAHIFDSLKASKPYKRIQENKNWLQDDKNRRSNSKLLFPKKQ